MSEIEANEKVKEAKYFLEKMRHLDFMGLETGMFEDKEFSYNLDGFLVAWHSILDVLRYAFAEKFSLGMTRQERLPYRDYFRHMAEALASKNPKDFSEAAAFYEWMSRQEDDLLKRHALLLEKRHVVVHRGTVKTGVKEEVTEWPVNVSTSGTSTYLSGFLDFFAVKSQSWATQAGSIPAPPAAAGATSVAKEVPPTPLDRTMMLHETKAYTYFKDDPEQRSIVSICGSAYEDMAQLVANAERGSWKAASV